MQSGEIFLRATIHQVISRLPYLLTTYPDRVSVVDRKSGKVCSLAGLIQAPYWPVPENGDLVLCASNPNTPGEKVCIRLVRSEKKELVLEWRFGNGEWAIHPLYRELDIPGELIILNPTLTHLRIVA